MKLKNYFTAILMIAVCGCGTKTANEGDTVEVIHVNPTVAKEYLNLSEIAEPITCIKVCM